MIDLRNCKPGDLLRMRNGEICYYVNPSSTNLGYPHLIRYEDCTYCTCGSRLDDGHVYRNSVHMYDIVEIIPKLVRKDKTMRTTETTTKFHTENNRTLFKIVEKDKVMYVVNGENMIPVTADELVAFHNDLGMWLDE